MKTYFNLLKVLLTSLLLFTFTLSVQAKEYTNTSFYVNYDNEDPTQYALVMPSVNKVYTHKAGEIQPSDLTQVDGELSSFPTYNNGELCFPALKSGASGSGGASKMAGNCYDVHFFYVQKEIITEGAAFMLYYDIKDKVQEGLSGKPETFQTVKEGNTITNANSLTDEDYTKFSFDVGSAKVTIFEASSPGYTVYTNPTDGRLSKKTDENGTSVTYYGAKDTNGYALSLDYIGVQDPSITGEFIYALNDGMIEKIYTPDGVVFEMDLLSDTSLKLSAITESGELTLNSIIKLNSTQIANSPSSQNSMSVLSNIKDSNPDSKAVSEQGLKNISQNLNLKEDREWHYLDVNITQCEKPVENATVTMEITPSIGGYKYPEGNYTGNGIYEFIIPDNLDKVAADEEFKMCEKAGNKIDEFLLGKKWNIFEPIFFTAKESDDPCSVLESQYNTLTSLPIGGIGNKYDTQFNVIKRVCIPALINNMLLINKEKIKLITDRCKRDVLNKYLEVLVQDYFANLTVFPKGGSKTHYPDAVKFTPGASYSKRITIELPPEIRLKKFYTEPENPRSTSAYRAFASLTCVDPKGQDVTMSWSNPNDRGDSIEDTLYKDKTINIYVPAGGESGIPDTFVIVADGLREEFNVTTTEKLQAKNLAKQVEYTKTWLSNINKVSICPESIQGRIVGGNGDLLTLPLTKVDDAWYMDEYTCYYSQDEVPLPGRNGLPDGYGWSEIITVHYDDYGYTCREATLDGKYHLSDTMIGVMHSSLRSLDVWPMGSDAYEFDEQHTLDISKEVIDNAVIAGMGVECTENN